jgi:hypothetical protein
VVVEGETLARLPGACMATPVVAADRDRQRIVNPRSLAVGQLLTIPALPFIDPDSGEVMS